MNRFASIVSLQRRFTTNRSASIRRRSVEIALTDSVAEREREFSKQYQQAPERQTERGVFKSFSHSEIIEFHCSSSDQLAEKRIKIPECQLRPKPINCRPPVHRLKMQQSPEVSKSPEPTKLPDELLALVFERLDLLERNPIRLVCRQWCEVVNLVSCSELVVVRFVPENYVHSHLWYGTSEFADQRNFVYRLDSWLCEKLALRIPIWQGIQRLRTELNVRASDLRSLAKAFTELMHLDLQNLILDESDRSDDLECISLPKLNVLVIYRIELGHPEEESRLKIESNRLATVSCGEFVVCTQTSCLLKKFEEFRSVSRRPTDRISSLVSHLLLNPDDARLMRIIKLSNYNLVSELEFPFITCEESLLSACGQLRKITCNRVLNLSYSMLGRLLALPTLKELHLFVSRFPELTYMVNIHDGEALTKVHEYIWSSPASKRMLSDNVLLVYLQGIEINKFQVGVPNFWTRGLLLHFQYFQRNWLAKNFPHKSSATLDDLTIRVLAVQPDFFGSKYPFISNVQISYFADSPQHGDLVLQLLRSFPHLAKLDFLDAELDQKFYDALVDVPGLIDTLNAFGLSNSSKYSRTICLEFLLRFERLHRVSSDRLTNELAARLVSRLRCPALCELGQATPRPIRIEKRRSREGSVTYQLEISRGKFQEPRSFANSSIDSLKEQLLSLDRQSDDQQEVEFGRKLILS